MLRTVLSAVLIVLSVSACAPTPDYTGVVTWVVDGDTIWVDGVDVSIRFLNVDAPELGTPAGEQAKWELVDRLYGETVNLYCNGFGYYGRWLCVVKVVG